MDCNIEAVIFSEDIKIKFSYRLLDESKNIGNIGIFIDNHVAFLSIASWEREYEKYGAKSVLHISKNVFSTNIPR